MTSYQNFKVENGHVVFSDGCKKYVGGKFKDYNFPSSYYAQEFKIHHHLPQKLLTERLTALYESYFGHAPAAPEKPRNTVPVFYETQSRTSTYLLLAPEHQWRVRHNPNWSRVPDDLQHDYPGFLQHRLSDMSLAHAARDMAFADCPAFELELSPEGTPKKIIGYWKGE